MRKKKIVKFDDVADDNRDKGKWFLLEEMPALQAERWGFRVLQEVIKAGIEVPANMMGAGMAAIAIVGLKAISVIPDLKAFELMDEMMGCVGIIRDHNNPEIAQKMLDDEIQEISTLVKLRDEVFELHTGFSIAGAMSKLNSAPAKTSQDSSSTQT